MQDVKDLHLIIKQAKEEKENKREKEKARVEYDKNLKALTAYYLTVKDGKNKKQTRVIKRIIGGMQCLGFENVYLVDKFFITHLSSTVDFINNPTDIGYDFIKLNSFQRYLKTKEMKRRLKEFFNLLDSSLSMVLAMVMFIKSNVVGATQYSKKQWFEKFDLCADEYIQNHLEDSSN